MRISKVKKILAIIIATFIILPNITVMKSVNAADMDPEYATPKHGIPVMYLNIDESKGTIDAMNNSPDHSANCYGSVDIKSPTGYKSEYTGEKCQDLTGLKLEYIRGRGNSTWLWGKKKPYKLKFEKGVDLFGMGKNKHWVLLADEDDPTKMKNRISYWLGNAIGMEFSCKGVPVEVVINGKYNGLYYLCEQVRVGKNRVDIDELAEGDSDSSSITGGYLMSMVIGKSDKKEEKYYTTREMGFIFDTPDFLDYQNEKQFNYICEYLQDTENALFSSNFVNKKGKNYKDYMDINSAADYYMIEFLACNKDGLATPSTYLYKKRNGKLYWGPVWDFDVRTYGSDDADKDGSAGVESDSMYNYNIWMERIKKDPEFKRVIQERWKTLKAKVDEATKNGGQIDKYYNEIKVAETYDQKLWGTSSIMKSYDEEIAHLKNWMKKRAGWIDANQDALTKESSYLTETICRDQGMWYGGKWYYGVNNYKETGSWNSGSKGYWFGDTSGWYAKSEWQWIDFNWYYFDENGYMASNEWRNGRWLNFDGVSEYYQKAKWASDSKGYWFEDGSGWYAASQWQKIDGKWYYFTDKGYMDYGEYRDGCWLGADGAMVEGYTQGTWHNDANGWWYSDGDWYPVNQYLWIDGVQYWFDASGYTR